MDGYLKELTIDVSAENNHQYINAKQGDAVHRLLSIKLTKNGVAFAPTGVANYMFRAAKPDGTAVVLEGNGSAEPIKSEGDGVYTITLSEQCLAVAGRVICDFAVQDSSENTLSSANFILNVIAMPDIGNIVNSSTEWERLMAAIREAENFSEVLQFRVSGDYIQYTTDGTTWQNLCLVSDIMEPMTTSFIDSLFA